MALPMFEEVLRDTEADRRSVLLGNGFSVACRKDIFTYGSLFQNADFSSLGPKVKKAFAKLKTTDFEVVIKALKDASTLGRLYGGARSLAAKKMGVDANGLKRLLVKTIANHHPNLPAEISDDEFRACRKFLSNFKKVYTLNYDLLLYWACMHEEVDGGKKQSVPKDDGFRHPDSGEYVDGEWLGDEYDYVTWGLGSPGTQEVFYLHGALHLFEGPSELQKFTWIRTGVRLTEQIRDALSKDLYPLIVAEGTSNQKRGRIMRSEYLGKGLRSFKQQDATLVTFGVSFSANDDHILDLIQKGKIKKLWVGIFGDENSEQNKAIISKVSALPARRPDRRPLMVRPYSASSANVWGHMKL